MRIAVLMFEGFNELGSFTAAAMINRFKEPQRGDQAVSSGA